MTSRFLAYSTEWTVVAFTGRGVVSKEIQLDLAELTVTVDIQVEETFRELGRRQVRDIDEGIINIYMASVTLGEDTINQAGVGSGKSSRAPSKY